MNKKGFTLAEVLITFGIIGVVAAITMPMLITHYQKQATVNQLKKAYSDRGRAGVFVRLDQKPRDENPPEIEEPYIRHFQKYPDAAFFKKEQRRVIRDAINLLSPRERKFILYRFGFIDGEPLTMTEVCRQFSLTETTAKTLEVSALKTIRREYEKNYKVMVAKLLDVERFLREDEGFYIPFVPPSVRENLPFSLALDDKTPDE